MVVCLALYNLCIHVGQYCEVSHHPMHHGGWLTLNILAFLRHTQLIHIITSRHIGSSQVIVYVVQVRTLTLSTTTPADEAQA